MSATRRYAHAGHGDPGTGVTHSEYNASKTEPVHFLQIWVVPDRQLQQDLSLWVTRLGAGQRREHALVPGRHAWVHVARGSAALDGHALEAGDAASLSSEPGVELEGRGDAEVLVFDLA